MRAALFTLTFTCVTVVYVVYFVLPGRKSVALLCHKFMVVLPYVGLCFTYFPALYIHVVNSALIAHQKFCNIYTQMSVDYLRQRQSVAFFCH